MLTPAGVGVVTDLGPQMMRYLIRFMDGQTLPIYDTYMRVPLLRHFPDDDPVDQFEAWSQVDAVVEALVIRTAGPCLACECGSCGYTCTCLWLLGDEAPEWQGSVHDVAGTGRCRCATNCRCRTDLDMPIPTREWFFQMMNEIEQTGATMPDGSMTVHMGRFRGA